MRSLVLSRWDALCFDVNQTLLLPFLLLFSTHADLSCFVSFIRTVTFSRKFLPYVYVVSVYLKKKKKNTTFVSLLFQYIVWSVWCKSYVLPHVCTTSCVSTGKVTPLVGLSLCLVSLFLRAHCACWLLCDPNLLSLECVRLLGWNENRWSEFLRKQMAHRHLDNSKRVYSQKY